MSLSRRAIILTTGLVATVGAALMVPTQVFPSGLTFRDDFEGINGWGSCEEIVEVIVDSMAVDCYRGCDCDIPPPLTPLCLGVVERTMDVPDNDIGDSFTLLVWSNKLA